MDNASTALIIAVSILIVMLVVGLVVYVFQVVSNFAQKQVTEEEVAKILQFNQPFLELESKATHDFSGREKSIPIGANAEDVLSIINYTRHINATTPYEIDFTLILNGRDIKGDELDANKQQEFIQQDLEERERNINNPRLRYHCVLGYDRTDVTARVNAVTIKIYGRD